MRRQMLVDLNPLLRGAEILFVKRYTYNSKHYYDDFQHISRWGGNLCVLSLADGRVRELVPQLAGGIFDRYDLSFDARRIVFGYRRPQPEGFRLYEIGVDGSGLRQVTQPPADEDHRIATYGKTSTGDSFYGLLGYQFWTDDVHPCYLPDGGLCFASTRCEHGVLCTPASLPGLHQPVPHGRRRQRPAADFPRCAERVHADDDGGRADSLQPLGIRVQGHRRRAAAVDHASRRFGQRGVLRRQHRQSRRVLAGPPSARPPATGRLHRLRARAVGRGTGAAAGPEQEQTHARADDQPDARREDRRTSAASTSSATASGARTSTARSTPIPIRCPTSSSSSPAIRTGVTTTEAAYGIYLLDAFGNRVPIYHDPEISCWQPMLLRPRPDAAGAARTCPPQRRMQAATGHRVRQRRVPRPGGRRSRARSSTCASWSRFPSRGPPKWTSAAARIASADGFGGHLAVSWNAHIWVAVLHGIVPVEADGSACFRGARRPEPVLPGARRGLHGSAADADVRQLPAGRAALLHRLPRASHAGARCRGWRRPSAGRPRRWRPSPARWRRARCTIRPTSSRSSTGTASAATTVRIPRPPPDLRGELTDAVQSLLREPSAGQVGQHDSGVERRRLRDAERRGGPAVHLRLASQPAGRGAPQGPLRRAARSRGVDQAGHLDRLRRPVLRFVLRAAEPHVPGPARLPSRADARVPPAASPPAFPELPQPDPLPARLLAWWPLDDVDARTWPPTRRARAMQAKAVGAARSEGAGRARRTAFRRQGLPRVRRPRDARGGVDRPVGQGRHARQPVESAAVLQRRPSRARCTSACCRTAPPTWPSTRAMELDAPQGPDFAGRREVAPRDPGLRRPSRRQRPVLRRRPARPASSA